MWEQIQLIAIQIVQPAGEHRPVLWAKCYISLVQLTYLQAPSIPG